MAGKTRHFGLAYFDYKDRLDTSVSVKLERDRFITIDDQLFGLFSIFGNGIVNGFRMSRGQAADGRSILSIEPGTIFCRNRSYESTETEQLGNYPTNGEFVIPRALRAKGRRLATQTSTGGTPECHWWRAE